MTLNNKGCLLILGIALGCLGLFLTGQQALQGLLSQGWPTVEGQVTRSEIEQVRRRTGPDPWRVTIEYTYTVDGTIYQNNRVRFAGSSLSFTNGRAAKAVAESYPMGTTISVHINPRNPGEAVLDPGVDFRVWPGLIVSLVIAVACSVLLFMPMDT